MAKTRHRTFEMYDFLAEARSALASKSARPETKTDATESWKLKHLQASHADGIVHVKFGKTATETADTVSELRNDFGELATGLVNGSRVVLDFEGLPEFGDASIVDLEDFNRKLQGKGSRMVLCNLEPAVEASFFPHRNPSESAGPKNR